MCTLYLHIGHSKTGSSFLQASFANSIEALEVQGFQYPVKRCKAAKDWKISIGNGQALILEPPESHEITAKKVLFSAERMFGALARGPEFAHKLGAFAKFHRISRAEILMFLRDPVEHASSNYQQRVKRHGSTNRIESTFVNYSTPERVRDVLKTRIPGVPIVWHVYNYERHKAELLDIAERFLGVPNGTLARGGGDPVNRSMTAGELVLLRALNKRLGQNASAFADALCNEAPEVPAAAVYPPKQVQNRMLKRLADAIAEVNLQVDSIEGYRTEAKDPLPEKDGFVFTAHQLEVIADVFATRLANLSAQLAVERARR